MEALAATIRAIASADELPGPLDERTLIPPVRQAWFRRVTGYNLWLLFTADPGVVHLIHVTRSPPMPVLA